LVTRRTIATNGIHLSVLEAGSPSRHDGAGNDLSTGPLVVLCHGFPESAHSWRHQMVPLAQAGWHVLAPDQRGYGASDRPEAITDYDIVHLTDDLAGLLDATGHDKAVFVGHDWGAIVVWSMAQRLPHRVAAVAGLSVPLVPRPPAPPTQLLQALFTDRFFYLLHFQTPGVAEADLGADPTTTLRRLMAANPTTSGDTDTLADLLGPRDGRGMVERLAEPETMPDWLTDHDLATFATGFASTENRNGFTGALNWYRNLDRNWELSDEWADRRVTMPSLFIAGGADPVLLMSPPSVMDGLVDDLRGTVIVPGAGHWIQQERPDDVTGALLAFLTGLG
jgi:pimeloyl-ACP methyl ester carboxylesterase